jgi:hypothetical protein
MLENQLLQGNKVLKINDNNKKKITKRAQTRSFKLNLRKFE